MKKRRKRRFLWILFALLALIIALWAYIECQVKPIMEKYGVKSAQAKVTQLVNAEVTTCLANTAQAAWIRLERDEQGDIMLLEVNSQQVNSLKLAVTEAVLRKLDTEDVCDFSVPLGTLLAPEIFTSKGPMLSLDVGLDSVVSTDIATSWQGAGINQTAHRVTLRVQVDMVLALSFDQHIETSVVTDYLVTETVLVGKVPEAYGQWATAK
ncbi:MAG: hypothetical protein IJF42_00625 [Clostridia bacterium]|nr:hypothetical protein [Clostridia bacterium]